MRNRTRDETFRCTHEADDELTEDGDNGGVNELLPVLHVGLDGGERGGPGVGEHDRGKCCNMLEHLKFMKKVVSFHLQMFHAPWPGDR